MLSKIYTNWDFWSENLPSGNPASIDGWLVNWRYFDSLSKSKLIFFIEENVHLTEHSNFIKSRGSQCYELGKIDTFDIWFVVARDNNQCKGCLKNPEIGRNVKYCIVIFTLALRVFSIDNVFLSN
jgi:hypothetical protein